MITARYISKGIAWEITAWFWYTASLQAAVQPIVRYRRFSHIYVYLAGPTTNWNHKHLFAIVESTTRWETFAVKWTSASCYWGSLLRLNCLDLVSPTSITSDSGIQFLSEIWGSMCNALGIKHKMTTAHHPQANCLLERFHRQLKSSLHAHLCGVDWVSHLPWALPGPSSTKGEPPTEQFEVKIQQAVHSHSITSQPLFAEASSSSLL